LTLKTYYNCIADTHVMLEVFVTPKDRLEN